VAGNPGRDDKKERVIARRGRLLKEKASPGPNNPFLFVIPSGGMGLRPTYEDKNVSVQ
jgi:hypothetical protein